MDQYEILRELGRGGTSVVYLVSEKETGRIYAMKVLRKKSSGSPQEQSQKSGELSKISEDLLQASDQLLAEATVLKALSVGQTGPHPPHPGIPAYGAGICGENGAFEGFLMEYVEGLSLQQMLADGTTYSVRESAEAGLQLCAIMKRLHRMEPPMIYRDLKPANILVRPTGEFVVVDYGAVRKFKSDAGKDTHRLGTEGYAAPEQYGGWEQSDERTDIYGIGAVLHHMLTGRPPLETGLRPLEEFIGARLPGEYSEMSKILLRCCSVAPSARYSSCAELEKALKAVLTTRGREAAAGKSQEIRNKIWKRFTILCYAAAALLTCVAILAFSSAEAGRTEYHILIEEAVKSQDLDEKTEAYRRAVRTRPEEPEAYLQFLRDLVEDCRITNEEREALDSVMYAEGSINRMRERRPGDYAGFQMELGKAMFCCYEGGTEPARTAFGNVMQTAGLWIRGRECAEAMEEVLGGTWTGQRITAWRVLERISAREAAGSGNGIFAASVCKAAAGEIALYEDRYEAAGADPETVKEVMESAEDFLAEAERGRAYVPEKLLEELRAAVKSAAGRSSSQGEP